MSSTTSPDATPVITRRVRLPLMAQVGLLIALSGIAVYLWLTPWRNERYYAGATLAQLQTEIKRHPDSPRILHYLALRLQEAGQTREALNAALQAAERAPFDEEAYLMAAAFSGSLHGDQSAFDILTEFVRRNPHSIRAHRALALLYQKNGAHERAFAEASLTARLDPHDADAFRIAAEEAAAMHKADIAETNARQAVSLAPRNPLSHLTLASVLERSGNLSAASQSAETAVKVAPKNGEAHLRWGMLLARQNRFDEALAQLTEAEKLLPDNGAVPREIGRIDLSLNHFTDARASLERARTLLPEDRSIAWSLVTVYKRLGDTINADREQARFTALREYQDRAADLKLKISKGLGNEEELRRELAHLCAAHDDIAGAQAQYRLLILHHPDVVGARHELAALDALVAGDTVTAERETRLADFLNKVDLAIAANQAARAVPPLQAALKANPGSGDLYNRLGRAFGQLGDMGNNAEAALVRATQLEPKRVDFALDAAEMLASNQKFDAAEAEYRRAQTLTPAGPSVQAQGALGRFLANERSEPDKNAEGERVLRGLLKTDPANPDALYGLGMLSLHRNDSKAAIDYLETFLARTGQREWSDVWFALARAYRLSGDTVKAAKAEAAYARLTSQTATSQTAAGEGK